MPRGRTGALASCAMPMLCHGVAVSCQQVRPWPEESAEFEQIHCEEPEGHGAILMLLGRDVFHGYVCFLRVGDHAIHPTSVTSHIAFDLPYMDN